ncbi:hypothetical protein AVEN_117394-1 [Araneus ventricosus]|uniref:Uncharacterized protein n=1 Tax=Araneus ventricosus TaxID=182803 RepID=A0A4Y2E782_ARAVE|nr:hypothetical protein AVEN_117394-1 [Araneus ventricosus]
MLQISLQKSFESTRLVRLNANERSGTSMPYKCSYNRKIYAIGSIGDRNPSFTNTPLYAKGVVDSTPFHFSTHVHLGRSFVKPHLLGFPLVRQSLPHVSTTVSSGHL